MQYCSARRRMPGVIGSCQLLAGVLEGASAEAQLPLCLPRFLEMPMLKAWLLRWGFCCSASRKCRVVAVSAAILVSQLAPAPARAATLTSAPPAGVVQQV